MITFEVKRVTPEWAARVLSESNHNNRSINPKRVRQYAQDMRSNQFKCLDPIAFTESGELKNGQHRLSAVVLANVPVDMVVIHGVDEDTTFDKGKSRSHSESITMRGLLPQDLSTRNIVSIAKNYLALTGEIDVNDKSIGAENKIAEFISKNREQLSATSSACRISRHALLSEKYNVTVAVFGAILNGIDELTLHRFCDILNSGFYRTPEESAAIVLRNMMIPEVSITRNKFDRYCMAAEMAIADFVSGTQRTRRYSALKHVYIKEAKNA